MKKGLLLSIALSSLLFANNIEAGYDDYFVTDSNGSSYSWGCNNYGDLGVGNSSNKKFPTKLDTNITFEDISSFYAHVLALTKKGKVYAWGYNSYGQLGNGSTTNKYSPTLVDLNDTIVQVSAGESHSLALNKDGKVYAWGYNGYYQLGDGTTKKRVFPGFVDINDTIIQVSGGGSHSLVLSKNGEVYGWGYNGYGQVGGDDYYVKKPKKLSLSNIKQIAAGSYHSLALTKDGKVYAWGYNYYGQLGDGTKNNSSTPKLVDINDTIVKIAAGNIYSMALSKSGNLYVWGYNNFGQLGLGDTSTRYKPVKLTSLSKIVDIDAGREASIAIDKDGWVYAWGYYAYNGSIYLSPKKIMNINPVDVVLKGKKFYFYDNSNSDENNKYISVINFDTNGSVNYKEYYLDGTEEADIEANLTTVDNKKAYFIIGNTKYWIVLDGAEFKMYKTGDSQAFMTDYKINIKQTLLDDKDLITKIGYRLHSLHTSLPVENGMLNMFKEKNNLTIIGKNKVSIYDISNPYVPKLQKSYSLNIKSDLTDYIYEYKAIKKGSSIYITGYFYGYSNSNDKKNNKNKNDYVFIAKFDITNNGLEQTGFKVLDKRYYYKNYKLGYDDNYIYLMASIYDKDGNSKERLYVFDNNLNLKVKKDLEGNIYDYSGNMFVKNNKIYVAYNSNAKIKSIDVSDLNYITEKEISFDTECCDDASYLLKDDNNTLYLQNNYTLIKLDENMNVKNIYKLTNVKAIKNNLALVYDEGYMLYKLNDDNTSTLVDSTSSLNSYFGNIVFVDDDKFFGYDSNTNEIKLGSIKAFDRDFDGVYDYEDAYPDDPLRFFVDEDGDGLADTINPNTSFDSPIYEDVQFDPDYFSLEVNITNPVVGSSDYYWASSNNINGNIDAYIIDKNGTKYDLVTDLFTIYDIYNNELEINNIKDLGSSYQIYPNSTTIEALEINFSKLPEITKVESVTFLNTYNSESASNDENTTLEVGNVYSIELSGGSGQIEDKSFVWFKLNNNDDGVNVYKLVLNKTKFHKIDSSKEANATLEVYTANTPKFKEIVSDYAYIDGYGDVYYVDENGDNHYLYKDNKGYYYEGEFDYNTDSYVKKYVSDDKFLSDGFYKIKESYDEDKYYVIDKVIYSLYENSDGSYYYYDPNKGDITIQLPLSPVGKIDLDLNKKVNNASLVLNRKNIYYFKIKADSNVEVLKMDLSLIKSKYYYDKDLVFDENGNLEFDFVLPTTQVYKFVLSSDNKFDANLTEFRNEERIKEKIGKAYFKNSNMGMKAGMYSLFIKGEPNSKLKLIITDALKDMEIEPNNDIYTANSYKKILTGTITDSNDVDFYGFSLKSTDSYYDDEKSEVTVILSNISLNENEKIDVSIYNTQYSLPLVIKHIYPEDIKDNSSSVSFNIKPGTYYVSVQKNGSTYPFDYTFELSENGYYADLKPLPLSNEEKNYQAQYYSYLQTQDTTSLKEIATQDNNVNGDVGEAIILAGIGDEPNDPLFLPTQILATTFYNTFKLRGFSDKDIMFLDDYTGTINNTSLKDAVDDDNVTVNDFINAIKNAENSSKTGPLYIYMVDHGTTNAFKISSKDKDNDGKPEIVYAKDLDKVLDEFQNNTSRPVVLIIEACKSGSFIDDLKDDNRVIITSSAAKELSAIMPQSGLSFTKFLAQEMLAGRELEEAFKYAKMDLKSTGNIFEAQHPQIYPTTENDILSLKIGGNYSFASMELLSIDDYYGENNETIDLAVMDKLSLYEKVTSPSPVSKAWAVVIPPNYKEVLIKTKDGFTVPDLTPYIVNFNYDKTNDKWSGEFDLSGYKYNGDFNITYYVQDSDGNVVSKNVTLKAVNGKDYVSTENNTNQSNNETTDDGLSINIYSGWNMVGITEDIDDMSVFDNYEIVWAYNNGYWRAYSPKEELMSKINSLYTPLYSISAGEGVWIYSFSKGMFKKSDKDNKEISFDVNQWYLVNYSNGVKEEIKNGFVLIWRYNTLTKKWQVYSNKPEYESVINTLVNKGVYEKLDADSLKAGDGIWFYKL